MENSSVQALAPERNVLERRLRKFLDERGLKIGDVLGETDQGLGSPVLAVASGSVMAGFGNHRSDLDLLVLVDNDRLTRFPIQSHEHGTLIDVNVRQAGKTREHAAWLRESSWPRFESVTQEAWNHRRRILKTTTRLALGLPLAVTAPWDAWHAGLGEPWLARVVEQWWTVEAHRLARAVRLLRRDRPLVAAIRAREAVVAALNARAAARGQLYFIEKWVGEKLRSLGDEEGLAVLREALAPPLPPGDRVARCLRLVGELAPAATPLHSVLRWAAGVGTATLDDRTVVDRWQLRALEVRRTDLPEGGGGDVLWSGPPDADPPADLHALFVHDMLWLGVAVPDEEVSG